MVVRDVVVRDEPAVADVPFEPVGAAPAAGTVFRCALCGTRFTHGGQACGACPLNAGCDLVKCPTCGYGFPRRSLLVDWVRKLVSRRRGAGR